MTPDNLIRKINLILQDGWTIEESQHGKKLNVEWAWSKSINDIVRKYRAKGWSVTKHVEIDGGKRFLFLTFKNDLWKKSLFWKRKS